MTFQQSINDGVTTIKLKKSTLKLCIKLEKVQDVGLNLNPEKCILIKDSIPFWGLLRSHEAIKSAKPTKSRSLNPIRHEEGTYVSAAESFVCCGSIRDFEKVKFSENS